MLASSVSRQAYLAVNASDPLKRPDATACPWVRSLTHSPEAVIHSPAAMLAAWPTTVTSSRCARALALYDAKAIFSIVVGNSLDEAGQHFLGW